MMRWAAICALVFLHGGYGAEHGADDDAIEAQMKNLEVHSAICKRASFSFLKLRLYKDKVDPLAGDWMETLVPRLEKLGQLPLEERRAETEKIFDDAAPMFKSGFVIAGTVAAKKETRRVEVGAVARSLPVNTFQNLPRTIVQNGENFDELRETRQDGSPRVERTTHENYAWADGGRFLPHLLSPVKGKRTRDNDSGKFSMASDAESFTIDYAYEINKTKGHVIFRLDRKTKALIEFKSTGHNRAFAFAPVKGDGALFPQVALREDSICYEILVVTSAVEVLEEGK